MFSFKCQICWGSKYYKTTPTQHITDPGKFAPNGSMAQYECSIGTYMPYNGYAECFECEPGFYCPDKGMTNRTACPAGYYCGNGSYVPTACEPGYFSNETHKTNISDCQPCPPGRYCQNRGATEVTGKCKAGHICYGLALYDDPVYNNDTSGNKTAILWGDTCHPGYYCPEGTSVMVPCPRGTYNPDRSGTSEAASCKPCDPGKYCNGTALTEVTGDCSAGYYCTGGAWIPDPIDNTTGNICPIHHVCTAGSDTPKTCSIGYHANSTGMSACQLCMAGFLCSPGTEPALCPMGYYCLASTVLIPISQGTPCPVGTFGDKMGLTEESNCTQCPAGKYCETTGLTNYTGLISAGHWSRYGSGTRTPLVDDSAILGICTKGHYCPEGSEIPTACPSGTYGDSWKLTSLAACDACDPGTYCPITNMTATGSQCDAGFYCSGGSPESAPVNKTWGDECPAGSYCPAGSSAPIPCPAGKYTNSTRTVTCLDCPIGHYCVIGTSDPVPCPEGFWCPVRSVSANLNPCLIGQYLNTTGGQKAADCLSCSPGKYCETTGLSTPTGNCDGGWYCTSGATVARPTMTAQGGQCTVGNFCPNGSSAETPCSPGMYCDNVELSAPVGNCSAGYFCSSGSTNSTPVSQVYGDLCPPGTYCPAGSSAGTNCPPGTYLNTTGAQSESDCQTCVQGSYCSGYGNTYPTAECDAGYYCPAGMNISNPSEYTCPQGHYCPQGSHTPTRCSSGTYQDQTGQGSCVTCPAGFFCDNTMAPVVLYNSSYCPIGYYCPAGTRYSSQYPCPSGTFGNVTGMQAVGDCIQCPGGYYCDMTAQTTFTQICQAGYYCRQGAKSGTPSQGTDADECPAGYYCPVQTTDPQKCPQGTYSNATKLTAVTECTNCTAGMYCGSTNLVEPSGTCWAGYYCPESSTSPTQVDCPVGAYCLNASSSFTLCPK
ncbi:multiple epidermal growth factor-like domains protein 6, partial [Saccostrea cucullata]|uniref:multiple epidermal growth factor-like domains protein 6 n=1 Tax=Saccostrea cuccullata TaxID=36930 RepID=UPI002ED4DA81